jgi:zinc and cadmium transporter
MGLLLGLSIHTALDGVALGAILRAEQASVLLPGLGVFVAILLHKPLDSLSIETMMRLDGWSERQRSVVNVVFAVLCPIAAFLFYVGFSGPIASVLPAALGFSAGAFICIALADLLPEVQFHSHDRLVLTSSFLLGLAIAFALGVLEPNFHQ